MHKILVITLYFLLGALHVSDYISPTSGATFISCYMAMATQQPDVWYRHILAYTKCEVQLIIKVAPDDGLTQSETCRGSNGK